METRLPANQLAVCRVPVFPSTQAINLVGS